MCCPALLCACMCERSTRARCISRWFAFCSTSVQPNSLGSSARLRACVCALWEAAFALKCSPLPVQGDSRTSQPCPPGSGSSQVSHQAISCSPSRIWGPCQPGGAPGLGAWWGEVAACEPVGTDGWLGAGDSVAPCSARGVWREVQFKGRNTTVLSHQPV